MRFDELEKTAVHLAARGSVLRVERDPLLDAVASFDHGTDHPRMLRFGPKKGFPADAQTCFDVVEEGGLRKGNLLASDPGRLAAQQCLTKAVNPAVRHADPLHEFWWSVQELIKGGDASFFEPRASLWPNAGHEQNRVSDRR